MTHQHNVLGNEAAAQLAESFLGIADRIQARTIPPAAAVLNTSHQNVAPQPTSQRAGNEHHPEVGQLPPPGRVVAAHLTAWQDENAGPNGGTRWPHSIDSEPTAGPDWLIPDIDQSSDLAGQDA